MPNSNYSVSNYEMFDDAISVTNSLNAKLSNVNEKIISSMNYISDDTFKGPAADVAMENYNNIVGYLKISLVMMVKVVVDLLELHYF